MSLNQSSSNSKGLVVYKILIDFSEYKQLKQAERFMSLYHQKINEGSKINLSHNAENKNTEKVRQEFDELSRPVQIGGSSDSAIDKYMKEKLDKLCEKKFGELFGNLKSDSVAENSLILTIDDSDKNKASSEQQGFGYEDSAPLPIEETSNAPLPKSLDKELLDKVPLLHRNSANELLIELKKYPDVINWDEKGVLHLNQTNCPEIRINDLFHLLFSKKANKYKKPGYRALATEILSLGLGHHIIGSKLHSRKRHWAPKFKSSLAKTENPFYYLGLQDD